MGDLPFVLQGSYCIIRGWFLWSYKEEGEHLTQLLQVGIDLELGNCVFEVLGLLGLRVVQAEALPLELLKVAVFPLTEGLSEWIPEVWKLLAF